MILIFKTHYRDCLLLREPVLIQDFGLTLSFHAQYDRYYHQEPHHHRGVMDYIDISQESIILLLDLCHA